MELTNNVNTVVFLEAKSHEGLSEGIDLLPVFIPCMCDPLSIYFLMNSWLVPVSSTGLVKAFHDSSSRDLGFRRAAHDDIGTGIG